MRDWLAVNWGVQAEVLYDKAPHFFHETTPSERHALFTRLKRQMKPAIDAYRENDRHGGESKDDGGTMFTTSRGELWPVGVRPALVVSSTSWTPDEDFGILLRAIELVDRAASDDPDVYPFVLFVVTGKGPQKAMYEERMSRMRLRRTHVQTMWLEPEDYPLLLGSADLGVCLHTSTSGLDLPMKVVDMFGCGLAVCAVGFDCLDELVRHEENGLVFEDSDGLAESMLKLLSRDRRSGENALLGKLRRGVAGFERWEDNWRENAAPVFESEAPLPTPLLLPLVAAWLAFVAVAICGAGLALRY